ncbi:MAG: FAD-dependent oxidoreductase, partial [Solirubrobacteraceae bacterium]
HLFEAGPRLGGQFRMACRIPGKEDYADTGDYFEAELAALGVEVSLDTRVEEIAELAGYDGVAVATGVVPAAVEIPGCELPHVLSYAEALDGRAIDPQSNVAIIGAGGIGVDVAHLLSHRGGSREDFYTRYGLAGHDRASLPPAARQVTLMRRGKRAGERIGPSTRWAVLAELRAAGVTVLTEISYERIEPGVVWIRDAAGAPIAVPADVVVIAAGQRSEQRLGLALEVAERPHLVIGGAARAEELDAERAFREGLHVPKRIGQLIASRP